MAAKTRIVHLSADFPDAVDASKTKVVRSLVNLTSEEFQHRVYSLNRITPSPAALLKGVVGGKLGEHLKVESEEFVYGRCMRYHALPKGILHRTLLIQLGDWIAEELAREGKPDLIIGHKLTVEGFAARRAALRLGIPYALSIQGNTDTKILAARPDLRASLRKIFHDASVVFPFTPWALDYVEARLGKRKGPTLLLPCATDLDEPVAPKPGGAELLSAFHLKYHRNKNLEAMVAAMKLLRAEGRDTRLTIIGGGDDEDFAACRKIIGKTPGIDLAGANDHAALRQRLNNAIGFVLPSHRESFGLVFIEALFSGVPIAYSRNRAIAGYVDDFSFAIPVEPKDPEHIADALRTMIDDEAQLKQDLARWQESNAAKTLTRAGIAAQFARGLAMASAQD